MILLDTNVVSEVMKRAHGHAAVLAWLDGQVAQTLHISTITLAELLFGIGNLPAGKNKHALAGVLEDVLALFGPRVLPFDANAARSYGLITPRARSAGKGLPKSDGFIAAIAAAGGFTVATRDTGPFEAAGVSVINPWEV